MLEESIPFWSRRLLTKPGLTGWAQVHCGYTADCVGAHEKLAYDFWYLRHRSLAVDLAICVRTLPPARRHPRTGLGGAAPAPHGTTSRRAVRAGLASGAVAACGLVVLLGGRRRSHGVARCATRRRPPSARRSPTTIACRAARSASRRTRAARRARPQPAQGDRARSRHVREPPAVPESARPPHLRGAARPRGAAGGAQPGWQQRSRRRAGARRRPRHRRPARTVDGAAIAVWGTGRDVRIVDATMRGNGIARAGISAQQPEGLVVRRVTVRRFTDFGIYVDANQLDRAAAGGALPDPGRRHRARRPARPGVVGRPRRGLRLDRQHRDRAPRARPLVRVDRAMDRHGDAARARRPLRRRSRAHGRVPGALHQREHVPAPADRARRPRRPHGGVGRPGVGPPAGERRQPDRAQPSSTAGWPASTWTRERPGRGCARSTFANQSWAAIGDYRGNGNAFDGNDFSGVDAGAAEVRRDHLSTAQGPMSALESITTIDEFEALAPEWDDLVRAMPRPSPFLLHGWLAEWWRGYADGAEPIVHVARRDGRLAAALPLVVRRRAGLRVASLMGDRQAVLGDLLVAADEGEETGRQLIAASRRRRLRRRRPPRVARGQPDRRPARLPARGDRTRRGAGARPHGRLGCRLPRRRRRPRSATCIGGGDGSSLSSAAWRSPSRGGSGSSNRRSRRRSRCTRCAGTGGRTARVSRPRPAGSSSAPSSRGLRQSTLRGS